MFSINRYDLTYWGAIDAHAADSIVMEGNFVSGAQRSGILFRGGLCPGVASIGGGMNHSVKNNIVHSSLAGVSMYPYYSYSKQSCLSISNFVIYKSVHWGVYYNSPPSAIIDSNILVDNRIAVAALVIGEGQKSHRLTGKTIQISNSIVVGRSSSFNCTTDVRPNDFNSKFASPIKAFGAGTTEAGNIGIITGTFLGSQNVAPKEPWFVNYFYNFFEIGY